jgi:type VI secretion system VasD/TssJ family lipoprotein
MTSPRPQTRGRLLAGLAAAILLATVAGCSKVPLVGGDKTVSLRVSALPKANSCGKATGYPLTFRVIQATDASAITGTTLAQLWDREEKLLGPAFVAKNDGVIDPGATQDFKFDRDPKAKVVVFVGNFCRTQGGCWLLVKPAGSSLKLTIDESCVIETK